MRSYLDEENTSRAAEFITDWSCLSKYCGIPERVAFPWYSRERTSDTASDWNTDLETGLSLGPDDTVYVRWGPNPHHPQKGATAPPTLFGPCLLWANGRPS